MDVTNYDAVSAHSVHNRMKSWLLLAAMGGITFLAVYTISGPLAIAVFIMLVIGFAGYQRHISTRDVLKLHKAERVEPERGGRLYYMLRELSLRARLPVVPDLYYVPSRLKNAFSIGHKGDAAVAITDGLFRSLSERELMGVMAHELSHIKNKDLQILQLSDSITRYTQMLSFGAQLMLFLYVPIALFGGGSSMAMLGLLALLMLPMANRLLQLSLSRTREFQADLGAVQLTGDPIGLASALQKLERQSSSFAHMFGRRKVSREEAILQSHPVTEERISRLLKMTDRDLSGLVA